MSDHPSSQGSQTLARRLLFWVLLISAVNALLAISVQLLLDYRRDLSDLTDNLGFIRQSQSESIAAAAWNFDKPLVQVQLQGLVRSPWVAGAMVRYGPNEGAEVTAGQFDAQSPEVVEYPLEFNAGSRRLQVGRLFVAPNLSLVYQRTLDRGLVVAITQGVKTLVFSIALLFLLRYLITRHLQRLAEFARTFRPGSSFRALKLVRGKREPDDELTALTDTLNRSYAHLNEFHAAELRQRERLEEEVANRTQNLHQALLEQQAIFDNTLTGIAFLRNREFQRCNASFEQMFGYAAGELIGQSARTIYPTYESFEKQAELFSPMLLAGGTFEGDVLHIRKDGSQIWCRAQVKLINRDDPQQGTVLAVQDITARRDAELALAQMANQDGLTGIANRRAFDLALAEACRRARREESGISLALIDVDYFKQYNDHYGHGAGDEALCAVARTVAEAARRPYDLAARYGGEEFVLLLPGCAEAAIVLERLRLAVLEQAIVHAGSAVAAILSISVGVVSVTRAELCEPSWLLKQADDLLYQAKHSGRNRVVWRQGEQIASDETSALSPAGR